MNIIIPEKQIFIDFTSGDASASSIIPHTLPSPPLITLPYPVGFSVSNDAIRISNKVGMAYGTLTDVAYVRDKINNIEFMLTATILVNDNHIFNDDIYEYESKGIPFLSALGRQVLKYERKN